jgi:hypothetical protein
MQQQTNCRKRCFLCYPPRRLRDSAISQLQEKIFPVGSVPRLNHTGQRYKQLTVLAKTSSKFSERPKKTSLERVSRQTDKSDTEAVVRQSSTSRGMNTEAKEATALEAVTRQPMKQEQTEKAQCVLY